MSKQEDGNIIKKWWFWTIVVVVLFVIIGAASSTKSDKESEAVDSEKQTAVSDYDSKYKEYEKKIESFGGSLATATEESAFAKYYKSEYLSEEDRDEFFMKLIEGCSRRLGIYEAATVEKESVSNLSTERIKELTATIDNSIKAIESSKDRLQECKADADELTEEIKAKVSEAKKEAEQKAKEEAERKKKEEEERKKQEAAAKKQKEIDSATLSQKNALRKAESYLEYTAFSRKGLIHQLEYEKFSTSDATWAVDHVEVNWNEQAAKKAKSYLDYTAFSRDGLIHQLEFEGFTHSQAVYGVNKVGL